MTEPTVRTFDDADALVAAAADDAVRHALTTWAAEDEARHKLDRKIKAEGRWAVEGISARRKRNQGRLAKLWEMRAQRASMLGPQGTAKLQLASEEEFKSKSVIVAENVSKSYGERRIIRDFSLRVQRGDRIGIERARQHRGVEPARPDRPAELVHQDAMLQLADAAPELDQFCPQARIVRLPDVAGHQMIGQPQRGGDGEQRAVLERLVAAADIGRR